MGLERLCVDLRRHPVIAHTRCDFKTHYSLGLYVLLNLSEKGLWQHAQPVGCTQLEDAPRLKTCITHDNCLSLSTYPARAARVPSLLQFHQKNPKIQKSKGEPWGYSES